MTQDVEMSDSANPSPEAACKNVTWARLSALSRRIGQRYGFASVGLSREDFALLGGSVHFEFSHTQTKGDIERGNPVPFSQVHCVGAIREIPLQLSHSLVLCCRSNLRRISLVLGSITRPRG